MDALRAMDLAPVFHREGREELHEDREGGGLGIILIIPKKNPRKSALGDPHNPRAISRTSGIGLDVNRFTSKFGLNTDRYYDGLFIRNF